MWCRPSIVDKWQTLETAKHRIAQWKSIHHVCKRSWVQSRYCLFQNLCLKIVNCHHLTTPSYNQCQNFWYGATSVFGWCVLQDLKHLNLGWRTSHQVWPLGKVKGFVTLHPSLEGNVWCLHSIVDKWQTLETARHHIAQWRSIHHVCERSWVWSPVLSLSKLMFKTCQRHHLTTPSYNQRQNFWYCATSVFGWCVLQDLKHHNLDPLWQKDKPT